MFSQVFKQLIAKQNLTLEQSYAVGQKLFTDASDAEIAAFLALLSAKGETVDELVGMLNALKEQGKSLNLNQPTLDIVGTGGDNFGTLNISTASALLSAALGITVVKHGNKAVSSKCGAADVLETLGYSLYLDQEEITAQLQQENFAFCYAPYYYPLLAKVRNVRQQLKVPTIFNLLGPLLSPAGVTHMLIGVYDKKRVPLVAKTLQDLGTKCSLVFNGNGLDELSCLGVMNALLVTQDGIKELPINPVALGLRKCSIANLQGHDALYNASVIYQTLSGQDTPLTDTLILNAAAALLIYGKVTDLKSGVVMARERLAQGRVIKQNRLLEIILQKKLPQVKRKSLKAAILAKKGKAVISEIKRASPSAGKIAVIDDPVKRAKEYVAAGAAGVSVLTDAGFEGSLTDLTIVASALKNTSAAILCKDFIISAEQIAEAAKAGADAILIMVSLLHSRTAEMVKIAHAFGLETLVEVHNYSELPIALASGSDLIGINQRDLRDFSMHPEVFSELINQIPKDIVKIAESGIKTSDDANNAYKLGYDAVLVGEALSRLDNPTQFFANLGV